MKGRSLQRTLAFRFSCTMLVALLGFAAWAYIGIHQTISPEIPLAAGTPLDRSVGVRLLATVVLGTLATAVGAAWLARSSVGPVREITAQARAINGAATGQRITAHADISEFQGLIEVLNAMLARLDYASLWHRRIIRDLGHDLKTPVASMRAGVEVALWKQRSPDDYRRVLSDTLAEIDRLGLICDALVLLGRLQSGQVTLNRIEIDARMLAGQVVSRAQEGAATHTIQLTSPAEPLLVSADVRLMTMVLEQLLDNAKRYTPAGSHIEVELVARGADAVLSVEDNGPGVPDEVLPHLFEPFYRNDSARGREAGPGLGLTATASIVAMHGGEVVAERGPAGGLLVSVTLPRASDRSPSEGRTAEWRAPRASQYPPELERRSPLEITPG